MQQHKQYQCTLCAKPAEHACGLCLSTPYCGTTCYAADRANHAAHCDALVGIKIANVDLNEPGDTVNVGLGGGQKLRVVLDKPAAMAVVRDRSSQDPFLMRTTKPVASNAQVGCKRAVVVAIIYSPLPQAMLLGI